MNDSGRNREQGWRYAKISGHINEDLIADQLIKSPQLQKRILRVAHKDGLSIKAVNEGGSHERLVASILGGGTKSKSDITLSLSDGSTIGISLKKSLAGQVYLITADHFIEGFEKQFGSSIPDDVQKAIRLFWGSDHDTQTIIESVSGAYLEYERHKHRLTAETLKAYSPSLYKALIMWFGSNTSQLFDFCFARGLAREESDWADLVWYKNDLGENYADSLFNIADVKKFLPKQAEYGERGGGTTILLPFGFVQWHSPRNIIPGQIQFHHSYEKLKALSDRYFK